MSLSLTTADLAGDFTLELRRVNGELMIVRAARAKLTAKDKKVTFQGMDEEGPVRAVLDHGECAALLFARFSRRECRLCDYSATIAIPTVISRVGLHLRRDGARDRTYPGLRRDRDESVVDARDVREPAN